MRLRVRDLRGQRQQNQRKRCGGTDSEKKDTKTGETNESVLHERCLLERGRQLSRERLVWDRMRQKVVRVTRIQANFLFFAESRPSMFWAGLLTRRARQRNNAAGRFAFPGCSAEWLVKRRPLSQWRDRAGFAPASLLGP